MTMDDRMTDLVIRISTELASLNTNMQNVLGKLAEHESRIDELEKSKSADKDSNLKYVLGILGKVVVYAMGLLGVVLGANKIAG